jgi:hypothetical protein
VRHAPKCFSVFVRTRLVKVAAKAQDVEMAAAAVAVVLKAPVVTAVVTVVTVVVVAAAKAAVDAVANTTRHAHKVHVVPSKAMVAVAVKAVDAHPWVTHNRAATKADLAAVWASVLPAPHRVVNLTRCAPVWI